MDHLAPFLAEHVIRERQREARQRGLATQGRQANGLDRSSTPTRQHSVRALHRVAPSVLLRLRRLPAGGGT